MRGPQGEDAEDAAEVKAGLVGRIEQLLAGRVQVLLDEVPQVFEPTEECVVCLGTEVEGAPDAVLYQCGHKCVHFVCAAKLRRCPLCRAAIAAVLPLATSIVHGMV